MRHAVATANHEIWFILDQNAPAAMNIDGDPIQTGFPVEEDSSIHFNCIASRDDEIWVGSNKGLFVRAGSRWKVSGDEKTGRRTLTVSGKTLAVRSDGLTALHQLGRPEIRRGREATSRIAEKIASRFR